jgi:hypothetical protein
LTNKRVRAGTSFFNGHARGRERVPPLLQQPPSGDSSLRPTRALAPPAKSALAASHLLKSANFSAKTQNSIFFLLYHETIENFIM